MDGTEINKGEKSWLHVLSLKADFLCLGLQQESLLILYVLTSAQYFSASAGGSGSEYWSGRWKVNILSWLHAILTFFVPF